LLLFDDTNVSEKNESTKFILKKMGGTMSSQTMLSI